MEIVPRPRDGINPDKRMRKNFERLCSESSRGGLAGMVMVTWDFEGRWNRAVEVHNDSFIGPTLLPSFVADILRRDTMRDVFHDTFMFIE